MAMEYTATKGTSSATLYVYTISYRLILKYSEPSDRPAGDCVLAVPAEWLSKLSKGAYIAVIEAGDMAGSRSRSKPAIVLINR
jgi:hypothetical protein